MHVIKIKPMKRIFFHFAIQAEIETRAYSIVLRQKITKICMQMKFGEMIPKRKKNVFETKMHSLALIDKYCIMAEQLFSQDLYRDKLLKIIFCCKKAKKSYPNALFVFFCK